MCPVCAIQPCHSLSMAHVQSDQPSENLTAVPPRQRRSYSRGVPELSSAASCTRTGHGFVDWEHWIAPIGDDRSHLVRSEHQNDGGQCSLILCPEPHREDEDRGVSPSCPSSPGRPECSSRVARAIALCNGPGFLVPVATAQGCQTSQSRQHSGEEHSPGVSKNRSHWKTDRMAQLPSFAGNESEVSRRRHQGRSGVDAPFQQPHNSRCLHPRGRSARARSEPKSNGTDAAAGCAKISAPFRTLGGAAEKKPMP